MFAAILLPNFRLQAALRFRGEKEAENLWSAPAGIVDEDEAAAGKMVLCELTPAAVRAGVAAGMSSSQALARCPRMALLARVPAQERAMSAALLDLACSLSLYVEQTAPDICTLDLSAALVGDHEQWAKNVVLFAARLELRAQVGAAANPDLALLAARAAGGAQAIPQADGARSERKARDTPPQPSQPQPPAALVVFDSTAFLAALPLAVLAPSPALGRILSDWGVRSLGDLARLPQAEVTERLGDEGRRLWEAAAGQTWRLLRLVRAPEVFSESFDFEHEVQTLEPLLFLARRFLEQLALRLELAYRVAGRMILALPLADGRRYEHAFTIPAPTAAADVLFRIIDTHLENLKLDRGPTGICLTLLPAPGSRQQLGLFENALRDPNRFGETLARLTALLGHGRVGIAELAPTHRPGRFRLKLPDFAETSAAERKGPDRCEELRAVVTGLPLRRFRPPFPAQVQLVNHCPAFIVSEKAHGAIADALGPYRLSGDWWDAETWSVEEWIIELAAGGRRKGKGRGGGRDGRQACEGGIYQISSQNQGARWLVDGCYE